MRIVLFFVSPNGTTRAISDLLAGLVREAGHHCKMIDLGSGVYRNGLDELAAELRGADLIGFGAPIYHMDVLVPLQRAFEVLAASFPVAGHSFKAFLYFTYSGITSGKAFINSARALRRAGAQLVGGLKLKAPHLHHAESFPDARAIDTLREFWRELEDRNFQAIDWARQVELFAPEKLIIRLLFPFAGLIGHLRRLPIAFRAADCVRCGKCIKECPVAALTLGDGIMYDKASCIGCYHCAVACPVQAVDCPLARLDGMLRTNRKIVGTEYPENRIFL